MVSGGHRELGLPGWPCVLLIGLGGKVVLEPRPLIKDFAKITMTDSSKACRSKACRSKARPSKASSSMLV